MSIAVSTTPPASAPAAPTVNGQLMDIGTVAAHNIAGALGLAETAVPTVRNAIRDEVSAMSSHFTLAVADVQTHYETEVNGLKSKYEADVAAVKSDFAFLKAHKPFFAIVLGVSVAVGFVVGHLV